MFSLHVHDLTNTNIRLHPGYEPGWACELCNDKPRNKTERSFHCENCLFDICIDCYKYIRTRKPGNKYFNSCKKLVYINMS